MCDKSNYVLIVIVFLIFLYLMQSNKIVEGYDTGLSVVDFIKSRAELSNFANFISQYNLTAYLNSLSNFTLFAPINTAFTTDVNALISANTAQQIIDNHIVSYKLKMNVFVIKQTVSLKSGNSLNNNICLRFQVNNAGILSVDNEVSNNGVVHSLDSFMMPTSFTSTPPVTTTATTATTTTVTPPTTTSS